jgi:hypothetical protein
MESTGRFEKYFLRALRESNTSGAGGAFGDGPSTHDIYTPDDPTSRDTYAPGDARVPKALGKGRVQTRKPGNLHKKRGKKKDDGIDGLFLTGEENEEGMPEEDAEKKKKADRCKRRADSVYGKKTSAYKSGAIVRCRQGKIWKKKK